MSKDLSENSPYGPQSKKYALVAIYKLWSAFSKGLRHTANSKHKPILMPRIGVWKPAGADQSSGNIDEGGIQFYPAVEL